MHSCPICNHVETALYISTNALMHKTNSELYHFHRCQACDFVFLSNPVSENDLTSYYTENYLPYRGARAWGKFSSIVENSQNNLDLRNAFQDESAMLKF